MIAQDLLLAPPFPLAVCRREKGAGLHAAGGTTLPLSDGSTGLGSEFRPAVSESRLSSCKVLSTESASRGSKVALSSSPVRNLGLSGDGRGGEKGKPSLGEWLPETWKGEGSVGHVDFTLCKGLGQSVAIALSLDEPAVVTVGVALYDEPVVPGESCWGIAGRRGREATDTRKTACGVIGRGGKVWRSREGWEELAPHTLYTSWNGEGVWSSTPTSCHDLICEKCKYERTAWRRSLGEVGGAGEDGLQKTEIM